MSTTKKELKALLHESIENIDDEDFLKAVKDILDRKYQPKSEFKISPERRKRLDEAMERVRKGEYYTHEEANKIVAECRNK